MCSLVAGRAWLFQLIVSIFASVQIALSVSSHFLYDSKFTTEAALSIINTSYIEAVAMVGVLWIVPFIFIFLFAIFYNSYPYIRIGRNYAYWTTVIGVLIICYGNISHVLKKERYGVDAHIMSRIVHRSIFYNYEAFAESYYSMKIWERKNAKYSHRHEKIGEEYETVVVVIGESVSASHFSLNGYNKNTTPNLSIYKKNLILFANAIAPAAYTVLSVPRSLSKPVDSNEKFVPFDSIILAANENQYATYWISTQAKSGLNNNPISTIGLQAGVSEWIIEGKDHVLVNKLKEIIKKTSGRKLIFLHMNGSHEPVCSNANNVGIVTLENRENDCYDNTIKTTDSILAEMISLLSDNSALLYFSDHGLIKINGKFLHAQGVPPKDAVHVPMFLWSNKYKKRHANLKIIENPYSLTNNYHLIADLMGINIDSQECASVIVGCPTKEPLIYDTNGRIHKLVDLTAKGQIN